MDNNFCYANIETSTPGGAWRQLSDDERLALVSSTAGTKMSFLNNILVIVEAKLDGQVIVSFLEPVPADRRGGLLLDFEGFLKEMIDPGLVVWLEPLGDRNSLRNLRGIEVRP